MLPGAPRSVAWVDAGRAAGLGKIGGAEGMKIVSLAAEARAALPMSDSSNGRCIMLIAD